jgi:hypothetical protein
MVMKNKTPKLKVRIDKKMNEIDPSSIAPEKHKRVNEFLKKVKLPE